LSLHASLITGLVSTLAGSTSDHSLRDGTLTSAGFSSPYGVAVDTEGNVYCTDMGNNAIRMISTSAGLVTTIVGDGTRAEAAGFGTNAQINFPRTLAVTTAGLIYVTDQTTGMIVLVDTAGRRR
jgi:DNA-binding beta-propeller fold protein YncE